MTNATNTGVQQRKEGGKERKPASQSATNIYGEIWKKKTFAFVCLCLKYLQHLPTSKDKLDLVSTREKSE